MIKKLLNLTLILVFIIVQGQDVNVDTFATGFDRPVDIKNAGDNRLFIVEQDGVIKILNSNGTTNSTPFLDIDGIVRSTGNEQGLLGLAFHPNYSTNGYFYVNYTNNSGNTVISRYTVSGNPNVANASSAQILMTINQPYSNHNGGHIAFGQDGYLYIGMGDGGAGGDPQNYSQNTNSLLGKMLRIDVNSGSPYGIPADNPFVGDGSTLDEIWAIGVRNPWKFSFDKNNGDLWIGDVGQNAIEEINHTANGVGGLNYGWRCYEGNSNYNTSGCSGASNYEMPVAQYAQGGSPYKCSITGGYVYRGSQYPDFIGLYFFADYCSNQIGTVDPNNGYQITYNNGFSGNLSTFGEDVNGELYVAGLGNGRIYKIKDDTLSLRDNELSNDFSITPNPANEVINIKNLSGNYNLNKVEVYNIIGSNVLSKEIRNESQSTLNISDLKSGVYFVKIGVTNYDSIIKKLIVN